MKLIALIALFSILVITGCCPKDLPVWTGPTDPMSKVVADINANNAKVPTLWAHHSYTADVIDDKKASHHVSGDGHLLYMSPISMRLIADAIIGKVFEIGSNPIQFWLKLGPETGDTMWWGTYQNLAKMNPDDIGIPIRPDAVVDVLGIATINPNFNVMPAPTMRFDQYADAYVFVWNGKMPDRTVALREVWYDRATKLPKLVLVYDMNGRVVLRAEFNNPDFTKYGNPRFDMKNYLRVEVPGLPKAQWPLIPSQYHLFFPESGSRLNFSIDEAALTRSDDGVTVPEVRSFKMPNINNPDVGRVIEVTPTSGN